MSDIPFVDFRIGSTRTTALKLSVTQQVGRHDVLRLVTNDSRVNDITTGVPITVRYGWNTYGAKSVWFGQVNHTQRVFDGKQKRTRFIELWATSPSDRLKDEKTRVWEGRDFNSILQELSREERLRIEMFAGNYFTDSTISQGVGKSTWELLHQIARRTGTVVVSEGARIALRNPSRELRNNAASAVVLHTALNNARGGVNSVVPETGTQIPKNESSQQVAYAFSNEGVAVASESSNVRNQVGARRKVSTARSTNPADARLEAVRGLATDLPFGVKINCVGEPDVLPLRPLFLAGGRKDYYGFWSPMKVTHELNPRRTLGYSTIIEARRSTRTSPAFATPDGSADVDRYLHGKWSGSDWQA